MTGDGERSKISQVCLEIRKTIKTIANTSRGGLLGFEMSRRSHFLDNQGTDSDKFIGLKLRPCFTYRKISGTHFC
jgi:hypothetical protein